ncbi:MAG TPA: phosphatase PAP2-related protein [Candidatus Paceibacterota bacterium]|nr:phosphatase PAP2-related protein [Candidatus Paceibacterota bacterium]
MIGLEFIRSFKDKAYTRRFLLAWLLLLVALVVNYCAGIYADRVASNSVTDIILDNVPVVDVDGIFIYGGYALIACIVLAGLQKPNRGPFIVKTIALFYVTRAIFASLTHIAPFPSHIIIDPTGFSRFFNFDGQLFFSGHTGLPFLMALVFWDNKRVRISFMVLSGVFAVVVLIGHLHYSIDVFSAFFITYAIYGIAEQIFRKDRELGL